MVGLPEELELMVLLGVEYGSWAGAEAAVVDPGNGGVVVGELRFQFRRGDEGKDGAFDAVV